MLTYAAYIRPCSWSKAANLPIATTQSMLHRTYCTAAITPNLHLWSMSRLVSFGLWKVQQFAKIQDLGLELAVSHCRHCNILSRHLCNIRFVFPVLHTSTQKNKNADSENMSSIAPQSSCPGAITNTNTHTHVLNGVLGRLVSICRTATCEVCENKPLVANGLDFLSSNLIFPMLGNKT